MDNLLERYVIQRLRKALVALYEIYGYDLSSFLSDEINESDLEKLFTMLEEERRNTSATSCCHDRQIVLQIKSEVLYE